MGKKYTVSKVKKTTNANISPGTIVCASKAPFGLQSNNSTSKHRVEFAGIEPTRFLP